MTELGLSLGSRVARGAAWMVLFRSADRALGLLSTLILARLLFPDDFGLVALATAISGVLVTFSEFGFDLALIQNQSAERRHYDTAWTFRVLRGVVISVILLLIAQPAAGWFNDARLSELVQVFAVISLIGSFNNIGIVEFQKKLVFKKEFLFRFSVRFAAVITTLALAYYWRSYWALVGGLFTASVMRLGLSYALHPYRPRFSLAGWRDIFHFSKWILVNSIISFGGNRLAVFVIGAILTPTGVGIYSLSNEVANTITQAFVAPIKRVLFPGYAILADDLEALKKMFFASYGVIVLIATPAAVGIGVTAELIVPLLLGERWLDTIPIIEILVYSAFIQSMTQIRPLFLAINRPDILAYLSLFHTVLLIPALLIGTWTIGIAGAAWATVGMRFLLLVIQIGFMSRMLHVSIEEFWRAAWRSLTACALMALSVYICKQMIVLPVEAGLDQQSLHLAIVVATGALTYTLSILLLWVLSGRPTDSAEAIIISMLRKILLKKGAN